MFDVVQNCRKKTFRCDFYGSPCVSGNFLRSYEVDSAQELLACGLCNVTGAFFGCFVATQAPPRTLVNESAGGRSQLAGAVSTLVPLLVVLALCTLFEALPVSVLGCVTTCALLPLMKQFAQLRSVLLIPLRLLLLPVLSPNHHHPLLRSISSQSISLDHFYYVRCLHSTQDIFTPHIHLIIIISVPNNNSDNTNNINNNNNNNNNSTNIYKTHNG